MPREKRQDETPGAPEWMVTFSDCMTLLLTFFVLLLSFSSFDDKVYHRMSTTMVKDLSTVFAEAKRDKDSFTTQKQIEPDEIIKGSEKPVLDSKVQGNMSESKPEEMRRFKVFVKPSNEVFLAKGFVISKEGRNTLGTLAAFLKEMPGRVIISENGKDDSEMGLNRAAKVYDFFVHSGLDRDRFSITSATTISSFRDTSERTLEIVVLERSVAN